MQVLSSILKSFSFSRCLGIKDEIELTDFGNRCDKLDSEEEYNYEQSETRIYLIRILNLVYRCAKLSCQPFHFGQ